MLLRRRLLLLFVGVVLVVVVAGGIARSVIRARNGALDESGSLGVAREQVAGLRAAYSEQEAGQRGFVLTGVEATLVPYLDGIEAANRVVSSLRAVAADVEELRGPLAAAVASSRRWRSEVAEPEIELRRTGDLAAALASVDSGRGVALFDRIRSDLDHLQRRVAEAADDADDRATGTRRQLTVLVAVLIGVVLAGTIVAAWLIRRWVTRPVGLLIGDVRRIRGGAFDAPPIRATGPPEIVELGRNIEQMREAIDEQRLAAERAREAVEQNAGVVLALRSQLEPEVGDLPLGWTIAAQLRAAEGIVAGDCYDLVILGGGRLGLIVVDISGHGATEGILALRCKELLRASLAAGAAPGEALQAMSEQVGEMGPEVFLTAFVAVVDTGDGRVGYANAGHPPAFICSESLDAELEPTGPLVGLLGSGWETREAIMMPGDNLCAFTDGLIEVRNADLEFFGPERLRALVRAGRCDEAPAIVQRCLDEAELFAEGRMRDDATIVVLCRPELQSSTLAKSASEV